MKFIELFVSHFENIIFLILLKSKSFTCVHEQGHEANKYEAPMRVASPLVCVCVSVVLVKACGRVRA